jgi:Kef-type K+ transport system membrane component KefB
MEKLFFEIALVLVLAGGVSLIVNWLKQPAILAYIVTGLIIGPLGAFALHEPDILHALSQIGITLLLFMVGLELDITQLKSMGWRSAVAGIAQVAFTSFFGTLLALALGLSMVPAIYIGIGLTFSSTIIVVKLLTEKKELQSLYGRLVVGIFLTQDFVALIILMLLSGGLNAPSALPAYAQLALIVIKGVLLGSFVALISKYVFPKIMHHIGKSDELLLVFSLAWAMGLAVFVQLPFMGFSLEIGGFLAGIALSRTAVHHEISARIRSLRDFFIIIFFIVLGSQLTMSGLSAMLWPAIILSLFVILVNPFIVQIILSSLGYTRKTSFFAGITVGQVSEFSLILAALGVKLGHIFPEISGLVTLIAMITITVSSYAILRGETLYRILEPLLALFTFGQGQAEKHLKIQTQLKNHVVLIGVHRTGKQLANSLIKSKTKFVIVDFNPEIAEYYNSMGVPAICGDASDPYIQELAGFEHARIIISTMPNLQDNKAIVETVQNQKLKAKLIIMAQQEGDAEKLYEHGAHYVLLPHYINSIHLERIINHEKPTLHLNRLRQHHLKALRAS